MYMYRHKKSNVIYRNGNLEITKREVVLSVALVFVMFIIGFIIYNNISNAILLEHQKYQTALQIENEQDIFQYGMKTDVGYAFIHGDLQAVDTVSYPEVTGKYMYIEKVKEKYTMHTRTVTTTVNGKTRTRTEVYWTWDRVSSESQKCNQVQFTGVVFDSNKIQLPEEEYIDTVKESSHIRYKFYGVGTKYTGTIFTELKDDTIKDDSTFYNDMNIQDVIDHLCSGYELIIFWIFWIILTGGCIFLFYYIDNRWIE